MHYICENDNSFAIYFVEICPSIILNVKTTEHYQHNDPTLHRFIVKPYLLFLYFDSEAPSGRKYILFNTLLLNLLLELKSDLYMETL